MYPKTITQLADRALFAGADPDFVEYLVDQIGQRIDSGRSADSDEYRALENLAKGNDQ